MGMKISLTYGSTTIDLQASGCKVLDGYYPKTPGAEDERLVEEMECLFIGTEAAAEALVQGIQNLFGYAYAQQDQENPKQAVYFNFAIDADHTAWRSRVYQGRINFTGKLYKHWRNGQVRFNLLMTRDAFWEGAEVQLPLTNGNGTDITDEINVFNCNDGTGTSPNKLNNWVKINAADVEGDLPGPVRLSIADITEGSPELSYYNELFIAHWIDEFGEGQPTTVIEAEDMYDITEHSDSGCSGGAYGTWDLPLYWGELNVDRPYILVGDIDQFNGRAFRVVVRFQDEPPDGTWMKATIDNFVETPAVRLGIGLTQSLGILQVPTYLKPGYMSLQLDGYNAEIQTGQSVNIDAVYLLGVDHYVHLGVTDQDNAMQAANYMFAQWSPDQIYIEVPTAGNYGRLFFDIIEGSGIFLKGGKDQWLYFLVGKAEENSQPAINFKIGLKAYYRPRKASL